MRRATLGEDSCPALYPKSPSPALLPHVSSADILAVFVDAINQPLTTPFSSAQPPSPYEARVTGMRRQLELDW